MKLIVDKKEIEKGYPGPRTRGALLFRKFRKFELSQQMRAADDATHTAMLNQMRTPDPGCSYIYSDHFASIKILTTNDIREDKL
jgi:hypothetical protein